MRMNICINLNKDKDKPVELIKVMGKLDSPFVTCDSVACLGKEIACTECIFADEGGYIQLDENLMYTAERLIKEGRLKAILPIGSKADLKAIYGIE